MDILFAEKMRESQLVEITTIPYQLRYATSNNFAQRVLYNAVDNPFLHEIAAKKLMLVQQFLLEKHQISLFIWDAFRPKTVQQEMWNHAEPSWKGVFIANPETGSMHNFGFAVDVTLIDSKTNMFLDMGTDFDDFSELARTDAEPMLEAQQKLTKTQVENRKLLRNSMVQFGFNAIDSEWWHFEALDKQTVRSNYKMLDL